MAKGEFLVSNLLVCTATTRLWNILQTPSQHVFFSPNLRNFDLKKDEMEIKTLITVRQTKKRLRWSRGRVLAFGAQVRGFKPGRSCRIFQGEKILSTPSFGGEVKPSVPCCTYKACKGSLNATWKSGISGKNSSAISRPHSSTFRY
jgi:hypothetical protein